MTEQLSFNNFGFIGFGLIGGSIAHALKEIYPSSNIIAYNYYKTKTHKKLEAAKQDGIVDNISTSLIFQIVMLYFFVLRFLLIFLILTNSHLTYQKIVYLLMLEV